jgi:hypothetical protein
MRLEENLLKDNKILANNVVCNEIILFTFVNSASFYLKYPVTVRSTDQFSVSYKLECY